MTIVAISRGSYSGGRSLAECVAKKLGYESVSREQNLEAAAVLSGGPSDELYTETAPALWERLGGKTDTFPYLTYLRAALCDRIRAQGGNLIYHGLFGHLLLPDFPHVLRVRVIADMEYRVDALMRERKLSRADALAYIERVDRERREWVKSLFGVDWDDLSRFDMVVNLSALEISAACDAVVHVAQHKQFAPTPESKKAMEDLSLASMVSAALVRDPSTAKAELKVAADGGVVTVTGSARTRESLEAVPQVAGRVSGVTETRNKVEIRKRSTTRSE